MKSKPQSRKVSRDIPVELRLPKDYPWKVLASVKDDLREYLDESSIEKIETIIRNRDVSGLGILKDIWGLQCITHQAGPEFQLQKAQYQIAALLSKYDFTGDSKAKELRAIEKFLAAEDQCRSFNLEGWKELVSSTVGWKVEAFTYAKAFLQKLLGVTLPESSQLGEWSRHGPGATLDTERGKVSSYHKYEKWPYQCTGAALVLAKIAIRSDERWLGALEDSYRERFNIPKHAILNRKVFWETVLQIVDCDQIAFVPKNAEIFRTITIGPTLNIYLQLGVDGFIRRRLKRWGVDLDSQEKNQRLARIGSLGGIDPFVTLDLKSASDTISLKICELLLPDEWYSFLLKLRTPKASHGEDVYILQKMSAMGNGFTFVLESAIFTSLIYGVTMVTRGAFDQREFSVFGDDLIVRQSLSSRLITLLLDCGFKLNSEKSFTSGYIRESCGTDWVKGKPVRPVFLSTQPSNVAELFVDINRIQRMFDLRWGLRESKTVKMMVKWIPENARDCVGPISDTEFDSHLHCFTPCKRARGGKWEYKVIRLRGCDCAANSFLVRRLMHDLRDGPVPVIYGSRATGKGSRFTVQFRNKFTVGKRNSAAYEWPSEYAESYPPLLLRT